jgi:hypothetical protein
LEDNRDKPTTHFKEGKKKKKKVEKKKIKTIACSIFILDPRE